MSGGYTEDVEVMLEKMTAHGMIDAEREAAIRRRLDAGETTRALELLTAGR